MIKRSHHTTLYTRLLVLLSGLLLCLAACDSAAPSALPPTVATVAATSAPAAVSTSVPAQPTDAATSACEEYFQFCNTIQIHGSLTAEATMGSAGKGTDCATWAASDGPRVLELPFVTAAGASKITVALTQLGAYAGPGTYELVATTTNRMPDAFPAVAIGERTFSNGEGSAAVVTVAADGAGSIAATGLVELASLQVANPDPTARIDFAMSWTCQDTAN